MSISKDVTQALQKLEKLQAQEADLKKQLEATQAEITETAKSVQSAIGALLPVGMSVTAKRGGSGKRTLSPEARAKMAEAQKRRWAAVKKGR